MNWGTLGIILLINLATSIFGGHKNIEEEKIDFCQCKKPTSGYLDGPYWVCSFCDHIVEPPKGYEIDDKYK